MHLLLTYMAQVKNCPTGNETNDCLTTLPMPIADNTAITTFLSLVFAVLAATTVIVIIIQAIKFTLSSGDPEKAATARKSIIYALVGLAIALSAEAVVRLLIGRL